MTWTRWPALQHSTAPHPSTQKPHQDAMGSKQFRFVIRGYKGNQASGSVPMRIFDAEPDSALAQAYGGQWSHDRDADGWAVVNSNPAQ
ncbi:hypothetical protein WJX84_005636 [Apatococcus fuscideae]|uniref:Uncharacterized protein n=1 Tax=Apatococcus fuscideae TaxID=2026836 RepID=A0AAW1SMK0_9CHLO